MEAATPVIPQSWAPDGKTIVYQTVAGETGNDLWLLHLDGDRKASPLVTEKGNQVLGQISPDGKWLAYQSSETSRNEIYVVPFPSPAGIKYQVSNNSGRAPRWRHDSRELIYIDDQRVFWSVDIHASGSKLDPGLPKSLFNSSLLFPAHPGGAYFPFAVSGDGQRFVVQYPASSTPVAENPGTFPIVVVLNWLQDLKQRTAVHSN